MSLSRVIKHDAQSTLSIHGVSFESLVEFSSAACSDGVAGGFIPMMPVEEAEFVAAEPLKGEVALPAAEEPEPAPFDTKVAVEEPGSDGVNEMLQGAYSDGFREGARQAEERFASGCRALADAIEKISLERERIITDSEDDLVMLTMAVARKIIHQEVTQDRKVVANIVHAAVSTISERYDVVVRLHPSDYTVLDERKNLLFHGVSGDHLTFRPDETISCGGCVVDTAMGAVDARVETQLDELCRALLCKKGEPGMICQEEEYE
mgnify:CR=1 FL=1